VEVSYNPFGSLGFGTTDSLWTEDLVFGSGNAANSDHFGASLAAGDFNGDLKTDLAIGVPLKNLSGVSNTGAVVVMKGTSTGLTSIDSKRWSLESLGRPQENGAEFGLALAAGDMNIDGKSDLAIGIPFKDITVVRTDHFPGVGTITNTLKFDDAGSVAVIYGSSTGLSFSATREAQVFDEEKVNPGNAQAGNRFGSSLTAWNFGRNERTELSSNFFILLKAADLAIGIPFKTVGAHVEAGAVDVIYGSAVSKSNGLTFGSPTLMTNDSLGFGSINFAHFGSALY